MSIQSATTTLSRSTRIMGFLANGVFMPAGFVYTLSSLALLCQIYLSDSAPVSESQAFSLLVGWMAVTGLAAFVAIAVNMAMMFLDHVNNSARSSREETSGVARLTRQ